MTTASDLISCGPAMYMVINAGIAGASQGWGVGLIAIIAAKCVPELMADIALPVAASNALHSATSMLTPWGEASGVIAGILGGPESLGSATAAANLLADLAMFGLGANPLETQSALEIRGLDLYQKSESLLATIASSEKVQPAGLADSKSSYTEQHSATQANDRDRDGSGDDARHERMTDDPRETMPKPGGPGGSGGDSPTPV